MTTEAVAADLLPADAAGWEARIRPHLERSVLGIIDAGRDLAAAEQTLDADGFRGLCARLGMSRGTASKLAAIAANPALVSHGKHLPPSWTTLYELSKVPADVLEAAIADGAVGPDTERVEAEDIARRYAPAPRQAPAAEPGPAPVSTSADLTSIRRDAERHHSEHVRAYATTMAARVDNLRADVGEARRSVAVAKWLDVQAGARSHPADLREHAAGLLRDVAAGELTAEQAQHKFNAAVAATTAASSTMPAPAAVEPAGETRDREDRGGPLDAACGSPSDAPHEAGPSNVDAPPDSGDATPVAESPAGRDEDPRPSSRPSGYDGAAGRQAHHAATPARKGPSPLPLAAAIRSAAEDLAAAFDAAGGAGALEAYCAAIPDEAGHVHALFGELRQPIADAYLLTMPP